MRSPLPGDKWPGGGAENKDATAALAPAVALGGGGGGGATAVGAAPVALAGEMPCRGGRGDTECAFVTACGDDGLAVPADGSNAGLPDLELFPRPPGLSVCARGVRVGDLPASESPVTSGEGTCRRERCRAEGGVRLGAVAAVATLTTLLALLPGVRARGAAEFRNEMLVMTGATAFASRCTDAWECMGRWGELATEDGALGGEAAPAVTPASGCPQSRTLSVCVLAATVDDFRRMTASASCPTDRPPARPLASSLSFLMLADAEAASADAIAAACSARDALSSSTSTLTRRS